MKRREYLAALAAGGAAGLSGCGGRQAASPTGRPTSSKTESRTPTATATASEAETATATSEGTPEDLPDWLPVPLSELERGAPRDAIPAIVRPKFAPDWSDVEVRYFDPRFGERVTIHPRLEPSDTVVGVTRDGAARAYPLRVLSWHEIVNDDFGGPLLVTYCPLCATAVTMDRRVNGEEARFGVSGILYNENLVMYDRPTGSLWSQVRAIAIRGPEVGTRLDVVTSTVTNWGDWQDDHPDTKVLLPPPYSSTVKGRTETRNYRVNPYNGLWDTEKGGKMEPKTLVCGVAHDGAAKAYPLPRVLEAGGVVNDAVGGLPVVVAATEEGTIRAFVRRVDGEVVSFEPAGNGRMTGAGSTWDRTSGTATDGPHDGTTLASAQDRSSMYWFTWQNLHPETALFGGQKTATPDG